MSNEMIENTILLMTAAVEAAKNEPCEKAISFQCPICGGIAQVAKAKYNGHHHIRCDGCGLRVME